MTNAVTMSSPPRTQEEARSRMMAMLTLQCPGRCGHAVHMDESFDDCFSLRCAHCSSQFCAWCFHVAADGEDPHGHVLDCTQSPEDMRGSALYLRDDNGGPHVPPHPHRKFSAHWRARTRERALAMVTEFAESSRCQECDVEELTQKLDARMGSE